MTTKEIDNPRTTIGTLLRTAGKSGLLLRKKGKLKFALLPINDDTLDFLLEHSPKLIAECEERRKRAERGEVVSLEELKARFGMIRHEKRVRVRRR